MTRESELMEALETLNTEYKKAVNSKYYKLGKLLSEPRLWIKKFNEAIKYQFKTKRIINEINEKYVQVNSKEYCNKEDYKLFLTPSKEKIVIYTCITGGYDHVEEPLFKSELITYVLFTDDPNLEAKGWEKRLINKSQFETADFTMINRYIKLHPQEFFLNEYRYAIYIDGNIRVMSDLSPYTRKCNCKTGIAMHRHVQRICAYKEAAACILLGKGNAEMIRKLVDRYKEEGFPSNYGLCEATIIVMDLYSTTARDVLSKWWEELLKSNAKRDQLCLPYILWKMNLSIDDIGNIGENLYLNPKIAIKIH